MEFIVILILVVMIVLIITIIESKKDEQNVKIKYQKYLTHQRNKKNISKEIYIPYRLKYLLTKNEYKFYKELKKIATDNELIICPKVGLKDLFEITDKHNYMRFFGKIAQKHFDFLICDKNLYPIFAIELDDISHKTEKMKSSDNLKNQIVKATNFKLLRVIAKPSYNYEYVYNSVSKIYQLKENKQDNNYNIIENS